MSHRSSLLLSVLGLCLSLPGLAGEPAQRARHVRGAVVEHDDVSLPGTVRHLLRATVPTGLSPDDLRRCLDQALDEERLIHPQVDAVAVYLYEEPVYARFTGRATPLQAAVAHVDWAPAGDWARPARSLSGQNNRTVYAIPKGK